MNIFGIDLRMKVIFSCLVFLVLTVNAKEMPTVFIGTYNESNQDTIKNLIIPNTPSGVKSGHWNLTTFTEDLFRNRYKSKIHDNNFNLVLMDEFSNNLKNIVNDQDVDVGDKKIGFLHVNTYQNIDKMSAGTELVIITMNLIFAQIGEEANRESQNNNFEVRYTNGITVDGVLEVDKNDPEREKKIHHAYKDIYIKALGRLINIIAHDLKSKKVSNFTSDDIYFTIGNINLGNKSKYLAEQVYGSDDMAKKQIMMILQENLIRKIREDKSLDDVVLLYPEILNKIIVNNWESYLLRMNEVSIDGAKNNKGEVFIRTIKPTCRKRSSSTREIALNGYIIEAYVSELFDGVAEIAEVNSAHFIKSSLVLRIVIKLEDKKKIDALSIPLNIIKKKKVCVGQASDYYNKNKEWSDTRKNKVAKTIRKSVENITPKLVAMIKNIVKLRKDTLSFEYQDFCKE